MKKEEENPFLIWLKTMPPEYKESFILTAFESYLKAWHFDDKTEKMVEKIIRTKLREYLETKEVKEKLKKTAVSMLEKPAAEIENCVILKLIRELKNKYTD